MRSRVMLVGVAAMGFAVPFVPGPIVLGIPAALVASMLIVIRFGFERLVMCLMLGNAFLLPMNALRFGPLMTVSDVLLAVSAVVVLLLRLQRSKGPVPNVYRTFLWSLGLIAFGGFVASCLAADPLRNLPGVVRFSLSTSGVLLVVALWRPDERAVSAVLWAFVLGASISALVGFGELNSYTGRSTGLATHPNHLGTISMMAASGAVALAISSSRPWARRNAYGFAALLCGGVVVSGSRAAFLAIVAATAALMAAQRSFRFVIRCAAICAIMGVGVLAVASQLPQVNAIDRLFNSSSDSMTQASNLERQAALKAAEKQVSERPIFGSGFAFALTAHSLYLQLWVCAGLLGLFGAGRLVFSSVQLIRRGRGSPLFVGMMAGFIGFLTNAVLNNTLWDRYMWTFLALTLAVAPEPQNVLALEDQDQLTATPLETVT